MSTTAVSCGDADAADTKAGPPPQPAEGSVAGQDGVQNWVRVSSHPGKQELDPMLAELSNGDRLVVLGTDADFAAILDRLLRKGLLSQVSVGFVPRAQNSTVAALWGLQPGRAGLEEALQGQAFPAPLIRHDSGGVIAGSGRIAPIAGRVYCEDEQVLAGSALSVEVTPDPQASALVTPVADPVNIEVEPASDGLRVTVTRARRFGLPPKRTTTTGRAVQATFTETTVDSDGIAHPRTSTKWGWYRHTEDLLLVRSPVD